MTMYVSCSSVNWQLKNQIHLLLRPGDPEVCDDPVLSLMLNQDKTCVMSKTVSCKRGLVKSVKYVKNGSTSDAL